VAAHKYDNGGSPDGTLGISLDRFYGDDYVCLEFEHGGTSAYLTADQARAVALDLLAHATALADR